MLACLAGRNQVIRKAAFFIHSRVGLRHGVAHFLSGRHVAHFVGHFTVGHRAIRSLDKAVFIHPRIRCERVNQANIRPLWCFNRAKPAVVGWVHVAHLKTGTLTGQAARPKSRKTAFVGHF